MTIHTGNRDFHNIILPNTLTIKVAWEENRVTHHLNKMITSSVILVLEQYENFKEFASKLLGSWQGPKPMARWQISPLIQGGKDRRSVSLCNLLNFFCEESFFHPDLGAWISSLFRGCKKERIWELEKKELLVYKEERTTWEEFQAKESLILICIIIFLFSCYVFIFWWIAQCIKNLSWGNL